MTEIILACFILHNFLMGVDPDEDLIAEVDAELLDAHHTAPTVSGTICNDVDSRVGAMLRDNIARDMWIDY